MLAVAVFLLSTVSTALGSAHALAPRTSSVPREYYEPPWACTPYPGTTSTYVATTIRGIQTPSASTTECAYGSEETCTFQTTTGASVDYCMPDQVSLAAPTCGLRCSQWLDNDPSIKLGATAFDSHGVACAYGGPGHYVGCNYNSDGSMGNGNPSGCPPVWDSCSGPAKRHYRREDNLTAVLRKRHIARRATPQPLPS